MKEYYTTIRHQAAIRRLGSRDIYIRTLYSHVLNFTLAHGSWQGTYKDMEEQIEISRSTICRTMNTLIEAGIVRKAGKNTYIAVPESSQEPDSTIADKDRAIADSNHAVADSNPPIPLTNDINNYETYTHPRDAPNPKDYSFPDFCNAYRARGGRFTAQQHTDSYALWNAMHPRKRQAIMEELAKPDGFWRPRPDWLLIDYQLPQPKDYNGSREFDRIIRTTTLVTAEYMGKYGIYTIEDATAYNMKIKQQLNP